MDEYRKSNLELWNNWADMHVKSEYYDVDAFKAGKSSLHSIELQEVGDVAGKTLLHLQCHFGMDTLSWARLGAQVTGADFSDRAIALARSLSEELGIPASFVQSDISDLPNKLSGQFDIVFTSYGTIYWLPDMDRWAQVVAHFLKPGGALYIADFHPFAHIFENPPDDAEDQRLRIAYPYFTPKDPLRFETQGSYAGASDYKGVEYGWNHGLSEIINALIGAGVRIEFLHEFLYTIEPNLYRGVEPTGDGYWQFKDLQQREGIPLMFSIRATKPIT